jgi:AraC-like DNA-binding protein
MQPIMKKELDPNKPVVPIAYPRLLVDVVCARGFTREQMLAGTTLNPALFENPEARIAPSQFVHMVANAWYLTKDPSIGYEFGLKTQITAHGFLGYALMSCSNLREAISLGERFIRLRTVLFGLQMHEDGDVAVLEIVENYPMGLMRQFALENILVGLARAGHFITGAGWEAGEIWFDFPEPPYYADYKSRLPPMRFNRGANQLRFPRDILMRPLVMSDPVAAKLAVEQCERELALLDESDDIPMRVRAVLSPGANGYPDLDSVATRLFMSSRTLKRRLQQHGQTFQQLLDEVRRRDAIRLLGNAGLTLEQIAYRLGYADPANFTRAFRKWTGEAPSRYRESMQGEKIR